MIKELDTVVLATDLAAHGLTIGDVGTAVMVHGNGQGFEVEFMTREGATLTVVSLGEADVRPVDQNDIPNARAVTT
ncbi:DUF4926 domain-containing protein [Halochromatium roseum]|uniref:DUF4926 domain-containing protein n=1 Tax=Halochromatium roseum TaxID=391920 RepID=UPI001914481D|nr:DUF4926 domain-containing protein [Halochromatium roseum]MBK5940155.1 hypothetical protein [Halochromatium roseum]